MIKFLRISLLLAFTSSVWIGCSKEPNVADPPDPMEMTVTVWPDDSATNIARDVKPTFTFSHELNDELPHITVSKQGSGEEVDLTIVKISSTVYRIEFTNLLDELAAFDIYLHSAKGKNGEILSEPLPIVSSFTTQEVILPSLTLSVIYPPNNSEIPDSTSTLHYQANFELNPATVEPSFTLTNTTTGTQLNPTIDISGKDITVNVDGLLEPGSSYTAEFDPDIIRGLNGEKPTTTYSFSFSTTAIPLFTTPEGYLQTAGDFYDGKYYVGGYGPNDEGFVACFDWDGNMEWFEDFRINGQYTRVKMLEVNSTGIYLVVAANPVNPISYELWLNRYSFSGESLDIWKLSDEGSARSIASSENKIYLVWGHDYENTGKLSMINTSGIQAQINNTAINSVLYNDGYIYTSAFGITYGNISVSKWLSDLSDTLWVNEVQHAEAMALDNTHIIYASNRYWVFAVEFNQQLVSREIMQQYDDDGNLLVDTELSSITPSISDVCSDGINAYKIGADGLFKVDVNGNVYQIASLNKRDVFTASGQNGYKIAVADGSNVLKLFSP